MTFQTDSCLPWRSGCGYCDGKLSSCCCYCLDGHTEPFVQRHVHAPTDPGRVCFGCGLWCCSVVISASLSTSAGKKGRTPVLRVSPKTAHFHLLHEHVHTHDIHTPTPTRNTADCVGNGIFLSFFSFRCQPLLFPPKLTFCPVLRDAILILFEPIIYTSIFRLLYAGLQNTFLTHTHNTSTLYYGA